MEFIESLILGIIQGVTEFLPVSSSGHLEIAKYFLNDESISEKSLLFTVILHFGTALSTILVFWKDIKEIIFGLFKGNKEDFNFALKIILSMIPAAIVGVLFDDLIDSFFSGQIILVAVMLLLTGVILFIADRAKSTDNSVSWKDALLIGIAQMIAIIPGISRSGATISTSVLLGIDRYKAARFSFLMVVPLIFGKMAKDVLSDEFAVSRELGIELLVGFVAAFLTGIVACKWMIALVRKSQLKYFSYYCFAVGIIVLCISFYYNS
jgi:undecaprenyl-diphosphatase